jgi:hypothetical protein
VRQIGWLTLAVIAFVLIATANSGGYRYGVSDQAFYIPAIALRANPELFPNGRAWLEPQMRLWLGDEIFGGLSRLTGLSLPAEFAAMYLVTMVLLAAAAIVLARRLGCGWWTVATFLLLLTLRHRIAKTGANSLEGYFHPRMLAFAIGVFALASVPTGRFGRAMALTGLAALIHTTTSLWFVAVIGAAWSLHRFHAHRGTTRTWLGFATGTATAAALVLTFARTLSPIMDEPWLAVLADKDYLFSFAWPAYAWLVNLLAPAVIVFTWRVRERRGMAAPGEGLLVMGLVFLVIVFAAIVFPTEQRVALAVQLQVNRVFWLLDFVAVLYLSWWLTASYEPSRVAVRRAVVSVIFALAVGRGLYVTTVEAQRPLMSWDLPDGDWSDAMRWLETGPSDLYVLADPGHVFKHGSSVRVAALRDTLIETGKDTALAMYDRNVAIQVAERIHVTGDFEALMPDDIRRLRQRFGVDVMVVRADRALPFMVLYRNASFVIYDLR